MNQPLDDAAGLGLRLSRWLGRGAVAGLLLAALEVLFVTLGRPLAFDSDHDKALFARCMLGLYLGAGGLAGVLLGLGDEGIGRLAVRLTPAGPARRRTEVRLATLLASPLVALAVVRLTSGRRLQALPARPLLVALAVALAILGLHALVIAMHSLHRLPRPAVRVVLGAAVLLGAVGLHGLDFRVLPRLYPAFHVGLEALEAAALLLAVALFLDRGERARPPARWRLLAVALALLCLWSGRWALRQLSYWAALRAVAFEETTAAARLLVVAGKLHVAPRAVVPPVHLPPAPPPSAEALPLGPRVPDADVFLITVDAMRADRLDPRSAPRLHALAEEGTRFDAAYSQIPHTSFSVTTLLTGKYIHALSSIGEPLERHQTLADLFRHERYKTAAFYPPSVFFIDRERFEGLEREHFRFEYFRYEYMKAPGRTDQVIRFLEAERPERVFAWVHYFDPHEPYDPHPAEAAAAARDGTEPASALGRYDGEVRYTDAEVGRLVDWIRAHRPRAFIVFSADHGEEFGEHGGRYHGTTLYEEQVRVPLFVVGPGVPRRRVAGPVGLVDVAPTLLGLVDLVAPAQVQGHDLGPWLSPAGAPEARLPPTFADLGRKKLLCRGSERLLCDVSADFCELYDLASDPGEHKNLAGREPERVARLRPELDAWMEAQSRFERDPAAGERERALKAIERAELGDHTVAPELAALLVGAPGPQDPALARQAARALLRLPDQPAAHPALLAAARAQPDDPLLGALALRAGDRTPARVERLADLATRLPDDDPALPSQVRGELTLALAAQGYPAAPRVALLRRALAVCDDEELERRLLAALGEVRGPASRAALAALFAHLEDSVRTRTEAVRAIGALGDRRAVPPLLEVLDEERYVTTRVELARVLASLGDPRALPTLRRALARETEPAVQAALTDAIARLGGTGKKGR